MKNVFGKLLLLLSLVLLFVPVSCKKKADNPVTRYGESLIDAQQRARQAAETANLYAVKKSIQVYHTSYGHYPASLSELERTMGSHIDPGIYDYDPQTGSVRIKNR